MELHFGDVGLVRFPFTDQSGAKQRPAVVVSSEVYSRERPDVVILATTSRLCPALGFGESLVSDWQAAGLLRPSLFKPILATVDQQVLVRKLGAITPTECATLRELLRVILS